MCGQAPKGAKAGETVACGVGTQGAGSGAETWERGEARNGSAAYFSAAGARKFFALSLCQMVAMFHPADTA